MQNLKYFCLFICALSLVTAITGVTHLFYTAAPGGTALQITETGFIGRLGGLASAGIAAAMFYGIHQRATVGWKIGWFALAASYLSFAYKSISGLLAKDPAMTVSNFWVPITIVVIAGAGVTWYWGRWWKKQKDYFQNP